MWLRLIVSFEGVVMIIPIKWKSWVSLEEFSCYGGIISVWKLL